MLKNLPFDLKGGMYRCTLMETLYFSNKLLLISGVLLKFFFVRANLSGVDQIRTGMFRKPSFLIFFFFKY